MIRRKFIKASLYVISAVGAGASGYLLWPEKWKGLRDLGTKVGRQPSMASSIPDSALDHLEVLSEREFKLLQAIAEAILPPSATNSSKLLPGAGEIRTAERIDYILRSEASDDINQLKLLLKIFPIAADPYALLKGELNFVSLPIEARTHYLDEYWRQSPIAEQRLGFWALKKVVTVAYFSSEVVWTVLRYDGPYHEVPASQKTPSPDALAISPKLNPLTTQDLYANPLLDPDPLGNP